ncbi:2-dehydropantoate 2-reductase [Thalassotalea sp. 1_MG-2023]|uniref:ketopantoate reductase family protein n=1 Tax=Thalassotalea sp. 1_MG-2023 TaxID=3062680 RepID=UPI0026E4240B|nr:2-dehydropantoate 2-reductase [Thalassotalea sp. 1_MG-2023]MDO6426343.1 2-dehydropantoate 2-reductase [Thalassotalea sp. 1_MG-2023]
MKIVVIGQGAIGLLWYSHLVSTEHSPALLCSQRAVTTDTNMSLTTYDNQLSVIPLNIINKEQLQLADVVLLCLKAYDILPALKQYQAYLNEKATIILCHNGIIAPNDIHAVLPKQSVLTLLTTHGSKKTDNFAITHTGNGQSQLGKLQQASEVEHKTLTTILNQALPSVVWHNNIGYHQWIKLAINCVINPITALNNIDNGELLKPQYQELIHKICFEITQVAAAENIKLELQQLINNVFKVASVTAKNCSSMRADFQQNKATEIEHINGYIVKLAAQHQLEVPQNSLLYQQVNQHYS